VLYIAGSNRCGSTLLARLLGTLPGFCAIGEAVVHSFRSSSDFHVPCGCGKDVRCCTFWKNICLPTEVELFGRRWLRLRRTPLMEFYRRRHPQQTSEIISSLGNFYDTIAQRAGAEVIVDSSKSPLHAKLLSWVPDVDLHVVYLVRDPRSVVSSCRKPKEWLPGASPVRATARWLGLTLGSEYLRASVPKWRTLRYEDFVKAPRRSTLQIAADLGYNFSDATSIAEAMAQLGPHHMLGSNPDKLKCGPTRIVEKSVDLPWLDRAFVSALTAPLLWRYGYLGEVRRSQFESEEPPELVASPEMAGEDTKVDFKMRA
jgi:Sulfotransferase family